MEYDRKISSLELWILREIDFLFLSNLKVYDRSDSFPLYYEPNGIPFGSYSKEKLSLRSYSFKFEKNIQSISLKVETYMPTEHCYR